MERLDRQPTAVVIGGATAGATTRSQSDRAIWGSLKSKEFANLCSDALNEVADIAEDGLDRIGSDAALYFAFLRHSGLRR